MRYQIYEIQNNKYHAGSKAREDAHFFLDKKGFETVTIKVALINKRTLLNRIKRYILPSFSWLKALFIIKGQSEIILQNPFYVKQMFRKPVLRMLKSLKGCSIISLIHDVELLRDGNNVSKYMKKEFQFMKENSDFFIVHNYSMAKEFMMLGFPENSLVELGLFDYYGELPKKNGKDPKYDIVIAGNLSPEKSPYVYKLGALSSSLRIGLYGPNYSNGDDVDSIGYEGVFAPEDVPDKLDGRFGLVWDGEDIHTCTGGTGDYMRYNDPHKVSLYLFAGIPVIVWKEAAVSQFILERGTGFAIDSLDEISERIRNLSEEEYFLMKKNAEVVSKELLSGKNINDAVDECLKRIAVMRKDK